jgi:nitroreductase
MAFLDLARARRSIRAYTGRSIDRKDLDLCVESARYAPSACNTQPWSFIIIDDPEKKELIAKAASYGPGGVNTFAREAQAFIAIVSEKQSFIAWLGGKLRNVDFRDADIGIACAHLVLQAQELGIGSCILGWFNERKMKRLLGVPFLKKIEFVVALGYPADTEIPEKKLKDRNEVIRYNSYEL